MSWFEAILFIGILVCLIGVGIQDFMFLAISWGWLPLLAILFFVDGLNNLPFNVLIEDYGKSVVFLIFQLTMITFIFSMKYRKLVDISKDYLGLGDILFLFVLVFTFSFVNYLAFVIVSFLFISVVYTSLTKLGLHIKAHIPLAGAMAFILTLVKSMSVFGILPNLYSNQYLWEVL